MAMAMGMTVENQVEAIRPIGCRVLGIMKHENPPTRPFEGAWWQDEV